MAAACARRPSGPELAEVENDALAADASAFLLKAFALTWPKESTLAPSVRKADNSRQLRAKCVLLPAHAPHTGDTRHIAAAQIEWPSSYSYDETDSSGRCSGDISEPSWMNESSGAGAFTNANGGASEHTAATAIAEVQATATQGEGRGAAAEPGAATVCSRQCYGESHGKRLLSL
mmetsp:Transcript_54904/g.159461  ORF Transcript_54904/g.159461 Transcript_54904/m.159461 type:complete len:176 (+) Transcript_54904:119-646(+)